MRYIKLFEEFNEIEQILSHFVDETSADGFKEIDFFKGSDILKVYEIEFPNENDVVKGFYWKFDHHIENYRDMFESLGYNISTTKMWKNRYSITLYRGTDIVNACSKFIVEKLKGLTKKEVVDPYEDKNIEANTDDKAKWRWIVYYNNDEYVFRYRNEAYHLMKNNNISLERKNYRTVYINYEICWPFSFYMGLLLGQTDKVFIPLLAEYGLPVTPSEDNIFYSPFHDQDVDDEGF
jgi:hypothetical protein